MADPTEAVYEAAYEAFKRAPLGSSIVRAIVDHVWPLAHADGVAEGRRQAAEDIVAEADEKRRLAKDALDRQHDGDDQAERHRLRFLAQAVALEQIAARIAEGATE
jgi:hypothetical protein